MIFFSYVTLLVAVLHAMFVRAAPTNLVFRGETYSGDGTTYTTSADYGACGQMNSDSDMVIAVGHDMFDTWPGAGPDPNTNSICGRILTATNPSNHVSINVKVADRCEACKVHDIDFSPAAFAALFDGAYTGRFPIEWAWDESNDY